MHAFFQRKRGRGEEGFSLIELMVVMVIIGLMTSAAVILLSGKKDQTFEQAEKLAAMLTALSRESVVSGTVIGAQFEPGELTIRKMTVEGWSLDQWQPLRDNLFLAQASLTVAGLEVRSQSRDINDPFEPQVWFLPTGEYPPFDLTAQVKRGTISITGVPGSMIRATFHE